MLRAGLHPGSTASMQAHAQAHTRTHARPHACTPRPHTLNSVSSPPSMASALGACRQWTRAATSSGQAARPQEATTVLMHVPAVWRSGLSGWGSTSSSTSCRAVERAR